MEYFSVHPSCGKEEKMDKRQSMYPESQSNITPEKKEESQITECKMGFFPKNADILPPYDDRIFKLIFASPDGKPALIDLSSALLGRRVTDIVVRNSEIPPEDTHEKAERLDLNCGMDDGTQVDIEMQASRIEEEDDSSDNGFQNIKGKGIYYLCDLHASQPAKGIRRYDRLARTYQITFCSYTVFPERTSFLNTFSLRHDTDNGLLSDAIHVIYVELSKLRDILQKPVQKMTDLEKWAVFLRYANVPKHRDAINRIVETKEAIQMAGNLLMSVSQDEKERAVFRSRRMYQTDMQSNWNTVFDKGVTKGEKLMASLIKILFSQGRMEDIDKATEDPAFREHLYIQYGLKEQEGENSAEQT